MWWVYFGGDEDEAEHALAARRPGAAGAWRRSTPSGGPTFCCSASSSSRPASRRRSGTPSTTSTLGQALARRRAGLYLLGDVAFRRVLSHRAAAVPGRGPPCWRWPPCPSAWSMGVLQMAAIIVVLATDAVVEDRAQRGRWSAAAPARRSDRSPLRPRRTKPHSWPCSTDARYVRVTAALHPPASAGSLRSSSSSTWSSSSPSRS